MVWNSLPNDCRHANGSQSFKVKLKTMLAEQQEIFVFNYLFSILLTLFLIRVVKIST